MTSAVRVDIISLLPGSPVRNLFGRVTVSENVSMPQPRSGATCKSCERCLGGTVLRNFGCSVETFGTDIAGAVVAVGEESNLMYVSETDVTEACRSATHL